MKGNGALQITIVVDRRGNLPRCRGANSRDWRSKVWSVEGIERIQPEAESLVLVQLDSALQ